MRLVSRLLLAASCVTALPIARQASGDEALSGLSKYLPAVGLLIGMMLAGAVWLCNLLAVDHFVVGALLLVLWLALSGGIHFDGLMDTADGIFSHRSRERMLEIMGDSRVGNFAVMVGVSVLLLKFACLSSATARQLYMVALVVPAWARWTETLTIASFPYAKQTGMGKVWHDTTKGIRDVLAAAVVPVLATSISIFFFGFQTSVCLAAATVLCGFTAAFRFWLVLGGQTGDTYGAVVEIAECGALVLTALFLKSVQ